MEKDLEKRAGRAECGGIDYRWPEEPEHTVKMSILDFLAALYGKCTEGCITITALPSAASEHIPVTDLKRAAARISELGAQTNTYYSTALRRPGLAPGVRGDINTLHTVVCFYGDFDVKGPGHKEEHLPKSREEVREYLGSLEISPSILIDSGNGIHALWLLDEPYVLHSKEELQHIRETSMGFGSYLIKEGRKRGWFLDHVQDVTRMLRAPGTLNFKSDPPKECSVAGYTGSRYPLTVFERYKVTVPEKERTVKVDPALVGSAGRMCGKCAFIDHCIEYADELSEPWWHAFLSIVSVTADGDEKAHEWSSPYPGYSLDETEQKYRRAAEISRPCSCKYIQESLGFPCPAGGCGVNAPVSFCIYSKEEQVQRLLEEKLTKEEMYSERVVALADYAKREAPYLYECLIDKARKLKIRLRPYEVMLVSQGAKLREKGTLPDKPRPDFVVYSRTKDREVISCPKLAEYVRSNLEYLMVQNSMRDEANLHVYENGVYTFCNKKRFKGYIKRYIADYDADLVRMSDVDEVFNQLTTDLRYVEANEFDADEDIINFQNGVLKLSTMQMQKHSPDNLSTIQIPCEWKGVEVPTPVFDKYLDTLLDHDEGLKELVMEFIGVVLSNVKGHRMKKSLFLYGAGDTGKSQLKALVEKMLGSQHCIGIDLSQLEARFGTSAIYGKRLAGNSDMSYMTVSELKTFKQCTGGDGIFAEFKGDNPFGFVYSGLLWFCMNRLPKFGGDDGSWVYGRIMAVECRNVVPQERQDKFLLDKMYAEREGIVYKAVMALKRVIGNGYQFDEPECVSLNREAYMADNNSVVQFIEEMMEEWPEGAAIRHKDKSSFAAVLKVYGYWCRINGISYVKNREEFRRSYAEYIGTDTKSCTTMRDGRTYLVGHRLNRELADAMYKDNDEAWQSPFVGSL